MTSRQRLELELSSLRSSINDLLSVEPEALTEEQRGELDTQTTRIQAAEVEYRGAVAAEPGPETTETRQQ